MNNTLAQAPLNRLDNLIKAGWHNTVSLMRGVFLPYKKIGNTKLYKSFIANNRTLHIDNSTIEVEVAMHLLTQIHANILDILMTKSNPQVSENGYIYVECTLYELQKHLGLKNKNDTESISKFISQMIETTIRLQRKDGAESFAFHIIEKFYKDEQTGRFIVAFGKDFLNAYFNDTLINYKELIDSILSFKYPVNMAIARFMISQEHTNIGIDNMLKAIGINTGNISRVERNKIVRHILEETQSLKNLGIHIKHNKSGTMVLNYSKQPQVYFTNKMMGMMPIREEEKPITEYVETNNLLSRNQ